MTARTSITHSLQIAEVSAPRSRGTMGITLCSGKKQADAMTGAWGLDLDTIKAWRTSTIITLIEDHWFEQQKGRWHWQGIFHP